MNGVIVLVIGENLLGLIKQSGICPVDLYDVFSISIKLDANIFVADSEKCCPIRYGVNDAAERYKSIDLRGVGHLDLPPRAAVLACSSVSIYIPNGYIGMVQTKGTLARFFVSTHCTDSQIEPGFRGKITLEIVNMGPFHMQIPIFSPVSQLFIFKCTTDNTPAYCGKYSGATGPTIPLPLDRVPEHSLLGAPVMLSPA